MNREVARIRCPECRTPVREPSLNRPAGSQCSGCDSLLQIEVFPAHFRQQGPGQAAESILVEGQAACFYHPGKNAVIPCESCGRFLCALCDCDLSGKHYCPGCLETGRTKGQIHKAESRRTRYDNIALTIATAPLLIFYFTIITAPIALFYAIRHWNSPPSLVQRTRFRLVLAMTFAGLQILGWIAGIYLVVNLIWTASVTAG
jgi:hypothetical protein